MPALVMAHFLVPGGEFKRLHLYLGIKHMIYFYEHEDFFFVNSFSFLSFDFF